MTAAPPSTFNSVSGWAPASTMASTTSRVWKAMASTTARANSARPVPLVRPIIVPRAQGSHHGLPRPAKAGTKTTPALSSTDSASGPSSAASEIRPSSSRNHWTIAPVAKIDPSKA